MNPTCAKCKGAGIVVGIGLILYCSVYQQTHFCPFVPPEQHTHNEKYVPPQYLTTTLTVTSTAGSLYHDSEVEVIDDPERPGFKIHILKF